MARITATLTAVGLAALLSTQPDSIKAEAAAGHGTARIKLDPQCYSLPLRFVAGGFGGRRITVNSHGPTRLCVTDVEMVRALFAGRDLVREGLKLAAQEKSEPADIVIEARLPAGSGFVIYTALKLHEPL